MGVDNGKCVRVCVHVGWGLGEAGLIHCAYPERSWTHREGVLSSVAGGEKLTPDPSLIGPVSAAFVTPSTCESAVRVSGLLQRVIQREERVCVSEREGRQTERKRQTERALKGIIPIR
jgi:hypothetical protein